MKRTVKPTPPAAPALPEGIQRADLSYPKYSPKHSDRVQTQFDLWYAEGMGWCIPTLLIRKAGRVDRADRTYATTLDGKPVRIGLGPHVKARHTVYVRESRAKDLQRFLDIRLAGEATSGQIRDRISSRRAQTELRRRTFSVYDSIFGGGR